MVMRGLLLLVVGMVVGVRVNFENTLPFDVKLMWDSGTTNRPGGPLVFMEQIPASSTISLNSHPTHSFEIQHSNGRPIDVVQISLKEVDHHFFIDGFRFCVEEGIELLTATTSYYCFAQNYVFSTKIIPERKRKQFLSAEEKQVLFERQTNDQKRKWLNSMQPKLVPKLTEVGYALSEVPDSIFKPLLQYYQKNKMRMSHESWLPGDQIFNHWEATAFVLEVPPYLKEPFQTVIRSTLEDWIGGQIPLELTSFYGIRTYFNQSALKLHVDRSSTNAVSVVIQVDQDVEDEWMFEVRGHDGEANYLRTEPQQMIMYESASVVHGRPQKLNGQHYSNLFLHFRPKNGWDLAV